MTLQQEHQCIHNAKKNIHAFDPVYEYYFPRIYRYCMSRLGDQFLTEDVVSEIFMKAIEAIPSYIIRDNIPFGAWLYKTAHNVIIDHVRKTSFNTVFNHEQETVDHSANLDDEVKKMIYKKQVVFILSKIKKRYQEIISLRFFSELEISEIATITNLSNRQVSVVLHRALQSFRKKYKKYFPESEIFE